VVKVKVRLFHELRTNVGQSEIELEANTLNDMIHTLIRRYNSLKDLIFDSNGKPHHNILFYINNMVQNPPDLSTKLNDGDLVLLVPPAAGG
jgi:MoaD family protein